MKLKKVWPLEDNILIFCQALVKMYLLLYLLIDLVMLIYDKSGRELRHRILLFFFVMEILTAQESATRLDLQMVISPQQRKIIKFCGIILVHFHHRST